MSQFEDFREVTGTAMTQLPASAGRIKQLTLGYRTDNDSNGDACEGFARVLYSGAEILRVTVPSVYPVNNPTTFTQVGGSQPFAKVNALTWHCFAHFLLHNGMTVSAYELWLDVEWYPSGDQAEFF